MSFCNFFIEFSITPLAFSSVIVLLSWWLLYHTFSTPWSSTIINFDCSHCLSKHFTLSFPFSSFILFNGLIFLWLSFLFSLLVILFRRWFIRTEVILVFFFNLSLLFNVKYFSLLYEYFFANFYMFLQCLFYKFSTTCWALYSFSLVLWIFIRLFL